MGSLKIKERSTRSPKDDLISTPELVRAWVESNAKRIAGSLAAILIVLVVIWGIKAYRGGREANSQQAYFELMKKWPAGESAPSAGKWEEYIPAMEDFAGKYGDTRAGLSARMDLIQAYLQSKRYQDAVTQGQKLLGELPPDDQLVPLAGYQMAQAYEQLGNPDEAVAVWNRTKKDGFSALGRELHWRLGMLFSKRQDYVKAAEQYELALKAAGNYPPGALIEAELAAARGMVQKAGS